MTAAPEIKAAAARKGLPLGRVAAMAGLSQTRFSHIIAGRAHYPKAAADLARIKEILGITDPKPIPYDRAAYAADSTGITLPHELLEFLRNKARCDRAVNPQASMSRLFVDAVEDRYRLELLDYLAVRRREKSEKHQPPTAA